MLSPTVSAFLWVLWQLAMEDRIRSKQQAAAAYFMRMALQNVRNLSADGCLRTRVEYSLFVLGQAVFGDEGASALHLINDKRVLFDKAGSSRECCLRQLFGHSEIDR